MLVIEAEWIGHTYEAGVDGVMAEWPPHPARLFCALVAAHDRVAGGDRTLRWLEREDPPEVRCSDAELGGNAAYVVTNAVGKRGGHPFHPGRTSAGHQRSWPRAAPQQRRVQFIWPDAKPDLGQRDLLDELCARVPYFGRATSVACLRIAPEPDSDLSHHWVPDPAATDRLGVPYGGYLDALVLAHDEGRQHHDARRRIGYARADVLTAEVPVAPSPFDELVTMRFVAEQGRLDGSHTVRLTSCLRNAIRSRGADLASVHGHGDAPRVAFLAMPFVGHAHSDGSVGALGLALARGIEDGDRRTILRAFLGSDRQHHLEELTCGPLGVVRLDRHRPLDMSSSPGRWQQPSSQWATATPLVLDRFPKRSGDLERQLLDAFERSGYPRPVSIEIDTAPRIPGGVRLSPRQAVRTSSGRPARPLPYRHVRVRFAQPVAGPVIVGSMRYFGLGLMVPDHDDVAASGRRSDVMSAGDNEVMS